MAVLFEDSSAVVRQIKASWPTSGKNMRKIHTILRGKVMGVRGGMNFSYFV
jgi:hypothetical protein